MTDILGPLLENAPSLAILVSALLWIQRRSDSQDTLKDSVVALRTAHEKATTAQDVALENLEDKFRSLERRLAERDIRETERRQVIEELQGSQIKELQETHPRYCRHRRPRTPRRRR